jgi:hypothetical protein
MKQETCKADVINAPLPEDTPTYKALPNEAIISHVDKTIQDRGYEIVSENYKSNKYLDYTVGNITIATSDEKMSMNLSWTNSYNKTKKFGIATGVKVHHCDNLDFSSFKSLRKHTKNVWDDFEEMVATAVDDVESSFNQIKIDHEQMVNTPLDHEKIPEILGKMFYEEEIIRSTQLNTLTANLKEKKLWGTESIFDLHMHTTDALKSTHPKEMVEKHMKAHDFAMKYVNQKEYEMALQI